MDRTGRNLWFTAFTLSAACTSAAPPPAATAEQPTAAATASAGPVAPGAPLASASGASHDTKTPPPSGAIATTASSADGAQAAKPKDKLESGGRPLTIYASPTRPVTVGRDGAVVRTDNGAELRILAGSLAEPRNVLVIVDRRVRGTNGKLADVYDLPVEIPAQEAKTGTASTIQPYESAGAPFILKLPLPNGVKSANLAIERVASDPKTKKISSSWSVVPMTKAEASGSGDKAVFELKALPGTHVHLTSLPPDERAK